MKGIKNIILSQDAVITALQKYFDEHIPSGVVVSAIVPFDNQYPTTTSPILIPKEFQICFEQESENDN